MDPFVVIIVGGIAGLVIALVLLGLYYPGTGTDVLEWKPTRSAEIEIQNEIDDLDQMLEAANRRRRQRGEPELTEASLRQDVAANLNASVRLRDDYLADLEIVQMLEVKNKRRQAKGLPEITLDEFRASLGTVRILMVGGGCRGLGLATELTGNGHAVRVVTRTEARREAIEAAGCECWIGDPDRIGTLRYALENVTVLMWLLGTASGDDAERVAALHGTRLRMMLEKTTDTTVRGVVYENAGTVGEDVLAAGVAEMRHALVTNEIPYTLIEADPADDAVWRAAAHAAIDAVLAVKPEGLTPGWDAPREESRS